MSNKFNGRRGGNDATDPAVEPHADLRDADGKLLGGIVRRDGEWLLGMDGKMVGSSDSPATMLALIRQAKTMHERAGKAATLKFSDALRDAADAEARQLGQDFEEFEAQLQTKMKTGTAAPANASPHHGDGTLH